MQYETRQLDLLDYDTWIGKSAADILYAVNEKKGWSNAYPAGTKLPMWLSRVRNFFNECPTTITRLGGIEATNLMGLIPKGKGGFISEVVAVYRDERGRPWFQTPPGGTIYHSSGDTKRVLWPTSIPVKSAHNTLAGQSATEIFKLLRFDGTGGSSELILLNHAAWIAHNSGGNFITRFVQRRLHGGGRDTVRKVGQRTNITGMIIQEEKYASSYNFGDFYFGADGAHDRFDVDIHSIQKNFYVVIDQTLKFEDRIFPKAFAGINIVDSDKHFQYVH